MTEKKTRILPSLNLNKGLDIEILIPYPWLLILASIPYLLWEIYWAKKVGYPCIKWHTHVAVYYYGWLFFYLGLYFFNHWFPLKNYRRYLTIFTSVFITLGIVEALLVGVGKGDTYSEHISAGYYSMYNSTHEQYYRLHDPNQVYYIVRNEFKHYRKSNSLGYADSEWTKPKKKNEKRIACFGDSFTEGVGAPFDSTYPAVLRNLLQLNDTNLTVLNCGISGDDPCVNYMNYRDRVAIFKPDIIVQTLSCNDMNTDIATKGGLERFLPNGKMQLKQAPWWEPIFALCYVSRLFFDVLGYNDLLLRVPFSSAQKEELNNKAIETFTAYAAEAKKQGAILLVVLQPNMFDYYQKKYEYDLSPVVKHLNRLENVKVFDLLPYYENEFLHHEDEIKQFYWKQDGHHNPSGYALMARGIKHGLDSLCLK